MLFRSSIIATAAIVLIASISEKAEAHSWADCVDWRFNDPKKPGWKASDGKCFGYARQFPLAEKVPFGDLDSESPNRHYQQDPEDFTACSNGKAGREPGAIETRQSPISKAYGGKFGPMASVKAGDMMCVRWPAKNHAVKNEEDRGVFINMPKTITNKDPNQSEFMKTTIAKLPYKNCNHLSDTDHTPCGGCFIVPSDRQPGTYTVQWRWELNDNEWYTSCWDLQVTAAGPDAPPPPTGVQLGTLPGTEIGSVNDGIVDSPGDDGDNGDDDNGDDEEDNGDDEEDNGDDEEDNGDDEEDNGDDEEDNGDDEEDDEDNNDDEEDDEDNNDDEEDDSNDDDEEDDSNDDEEDDSNDDEDDGEDDEDDDSNDDEEDDSNDDEDDGEDDEEDDNNDDEEDDSNDDEDDGEDDDEGDNDDDEDDE
ncbi:hypothetical protein DFQ26_003139 [Actinomortierella ambigua]|nr:hypothetical protein DFQ26_003139 [Actinomortierella ambigua]